MDELREAWDRQGYVVLREAVPGHLSRWHFVSELAGYDPLRAAASHA